MKIVVKKFDVNGSYFFNPSLPRGLIVFFCTKWAQVGRKSEAWRRSKQLFQSLWSRYFVCTNSFSYLRHLSYTQAR